MLNALFSGSKDNPKAQRLAQAEGMAAAINRSQAVIEFDLTGRILTANRVVYLDRTGSGNETAAHLKADGRLTIMFCAFEGPPNILRLYGRGHAVHRGTDEYRWLLAEHYDGNEPLGTRQFIVLDVDLVQTSCGYGVPFMEYRGERPSMDNWSEKKGAEGLAAYQREKNVTSMDGLPTGLFEDGPTSAG